MIPEFGSIFELMELFPDEHFCLHCRSNRIYHFSNLKTFKCRESKQRLSIKVGTIFEDTKLLLYKWFMEIWLIVNHPKRITSSTRAKDLKIEKKRVVCS